LKVWIGNNKLIKFINLINRKFYILLSKIFYNNIIIYLFFFIWFVNIFHWELDDWVDIEHMSGEDLESICWQMSRYGFDIITNYYITIIKYIFDFYFKVDSIYIYFLNKTVNNGEYIISNHHYSLFWFNIISVIISSKFSSFANLFFEEYIYIETIDLDDLILCYMTNYIDFFVSDLLLDVINVNLSILYANNLILEESLILWKIFYIGNVDYKNKFDFNLLAIMNYINVVDIFYNIFASKANSFIFYLNSNINKFYLINIINYYFLIDNYFSKFILCSKLWDKIEFGLNRVYFSNFIYHIKLNQFNKFMFNYITTVSIYKFWDYYNENEDFYLFDNDPIIVYSCYWWFVRRYYWFYLLPLLIKCKVEFLPLCNV
jgi:hypothetical protein